MARMVILIAALMASSVTADAQAIPPGTLVPSVEFQTHSAEPRVHSSKSRARSAEPQTQIPEYRTHSADSLTQTADPRIYSSESQSQFPESRPNPLEFSIHPPELQKQITGSRTQTSNSRTQTSEKILLTGLDDARSLRFSTLGNLFIAETGRNRILKVTNEGVRVDSVGRIGSGDYQFDTPVAIDPGNELKIYIADRDNQRVQVFDRRLQYLSTIRLPRRVGMGSSYRPVMLSVDRTGRIYFFDEEQHLVYRYDSNGQFDLSFELFSEEERIMPVSMDIYDGVLWVADRRGDLLHRFSSGGTYLGFIYTPEPVRLLRMDRDRLWILGENNVRQIDRAGRTGRSVALPGAGVSTRQWRSFDIDNGHLFLLDGSRVVRLPIPEPED